MAHHDTDPREGFPYDSTLVVKGATHFEVSAFNEESGPAWSPDGRRLALIVADDLETVVVDSHKRVYVHLARSKNGGPYFRDPAWSPDGARIAFTELRAVTPPRGTLCVIRPNGTGLHGLGVRGFRPDWSPNGKQLVFDTGRRIAVINADGSALRYLTPAGSAYFDTEPAWSPDGKTIAFVRQPLNRKLSEIWLMDATGRNQRLLVQNGSEPTWKPKPL